MIDLKERLLKISDVEKETKITRRRVHYYLSKGLVDEPIRTGKTMAYYTQRHVQQLMLIEGYRKKGYPLYQISQAIKAINQTNTVERNLTQELTDRKAQITQKAVELFSKVGYNNTKISDITNALGMAPSSFYLYFRSKKEIFLECIDQVFERMFQDAIEEIRKERHPIRRLRLRAEIALKSHQQFFDILKVLEVGFKEDTRIQEKRRKIYLTIKEALKRNLEWAVREGLFPELNLDIVAYILIEILKAAQLISNLEENFDVDEFLEIIDMWLFRFSKVKPPLA